MDHSSSYESHAEQKMSQFSHTSTWVPVLNHKVPFSIYTQDVLVPFSQNLQAILNKFLPSSHHLQMQTWHLAGVVAICVLLLRKLAF